MCVWLCGHRTVNRGDWGWGESEDSAEIQLSSLSSLTCGGRPLGALRHLPADREQTKTQRCCTAGGMAVVEVVVVVVGMGGDF